MRKTIELYTDTAGQHRWRLRSGNHQITTGPEDGYRRPGERTRAMARDLAGIYTPDQRRDLAPTLREGAPAERRIRVGVLTRMEPQTDPHYVPGTFREVEITVVEVES